MNWPFKKRRDVIDLTYLAKRGLIKPEQEFKEILPQQQTSSSSSDSSSAFGFLSSLASSAESSPSSHAESKELGTKNKLEDIEYKLEVISKRVNSMIDRLDLVEKKLSRDLRQGSS